MNKLLCATLSAIMLPTIAMAEITPNDIAEKMKVGDVLSAEFLTKQLIKEHPDSAKAHYYMGQILATEGDYKGGYSELKKSAELDKSLSFASSPDKFRQEMDKVKVNLGRAEAPAISNTKDEGWGWFTWLLLLSFTGGAIWFFFFRDEKDEPTSHPAYTPSHPAHTPTTQTTTYTPTASYPLPHVVNNYNTGNDGLVEGMLIGSMMANHTIIERESPLPSFDAAPSVNNDNSFDAGSDKTSNDFDTGSSSFDSGDSGFDSGSGD